ncbi:MAG: hypothetical protein J1E01_08340 [Acetatifactor sp.]|nr:hypothetical protein [Acetatifactor sp.]
MRVSVCVGDYAKTPYCIPGLEMNVYCMEELCYCMKENAFLLDMSLMNDGLLHWIDQECGLKELARALHPLVHRQGSLSAFVGMVLKFTGIYTDAEAMEVEQVLKQGAGLSRIEKRKSQVDYLVKKKKYLSAIREYDNLTVKWRELEEKGEPLPAVSCLSSILHNKGVALAGLMLYDRAADCFLAAYETDQDPNCYRDFLAAKRMTLTEEEYVAFAAGRAENYGHTLELEKELELLLGEWEQQPEYLLLNNRRLRRGGIDRQSYYEEGDRLIQALKDSYRSSVSN